MELESKLLSELRVIDLRRELEKRGLDKNGVKAVLMERLSKALQDEGLAPDTHVFELTDGRNSQKGDEAEKSNNSTVDDEKSESKEAEVEIKKEVVDVDLAEEIKEREELGETTAVVSSSVNSDTEHLDQEDEALILNETEEGSLLGNEDEDDHGLQDEDCSESVSEHPKKNESEKCADDREKSEETDLLSEVKSEVLETVDTLDTQTEEIEHGAEDNNTAVETSGDPGPAATDIDNQQQLSLTPGDKNKEVKTGGANLWVSNLSPETKATDLKRLFSRHGKLLGAKIVTSARTPGARCYGYVTMANNDDADRCIRFLHRVELHGRLVYVEKAKDDATGPLRNRTRSKERINAHRRSGPRDPVPRTSSTPRAPRRRSPHDTNSIEFAKLKEERERQRLRDIERRDRDAAKARREYEEEINARDRERRQRALADRLEKEKVRLRIEREKVEREKEQLLKLERDRQRLERERLEREKEEIRNRKKRLQERPVPASRPATKRPAVDDKRADYPPKRQVIDKDELLLEPPPPPRFNDSERQRDRSRRDDKRPPPRREDYRQSSPARERYSRDKIDRRSGKDDSRTSRYDSKTKSHADGKNWSSNGTQYGGGYNREVWSTSRQDWTQTESSGRWPADSQAVSGRSSYSNAVYSGAAYSGHAQPSPPGAGVAATHSRYSDPRFDTYAHSLPVRKY